MPPPIAPLVILNPAAGMGRARRLLPRLEAALDGSAARVVESTSAGHATQLAATAMEGGHDRVVAVGGDGTVQDVLNGLMAMAEASRAELGIVPGGSGNDLARSLDLPRDPLAALRVAMGDATQALDVARATRDGAVRHFGSAGGVGFDAQVAVTMAGRPHRWQRGAAGYLLATLAELRRYQNRSLTVTLDTDGEPRRAEGRFLFVCFANGAFYGGGMQIAPGASTSDGLLDVCLVGDISRLGALRELPGIYRGAHLRHPLVQIVPVRGLRIEGDDGTLAHLDGEPFGSLPLDVTVLPGAVQVAAARHPVG